VESVDTTHLVKLGPRGELDLLGGLDRRFKLALGPAELRKQQNTRDNDHYQLVEALRPSTLVLLLMNAQLMFPRPVLATYEGQRSGHHERFEFHV
jgi:hypothetical protein